MIKVVSFDIGGTLRTSTKDIYSLRELSKLLNIDYNLVRNAYKNVYQKSKGTFEEQLDKFTSIFGIKPTSELVIFLKNKFTSNDGEVTPDKIELIKKLKELGYKVILFSNTSNLFTSKLPDELVNSVDEMFYSYDLGYTKNESESYKIVEKKMNYNPDEFIHIGDTLKADYYSPIENGWNALYYGETTEDVVSITSLDEVIDYLNQKRLV